MIFKWLPVYTACNCCLFSKSLDSSPILCNIAYVINLKQIRADVIKEISSRLTSGVIVNINSVILLTELDMSNCGESYLIHCLV